MEIVIVKAILGLITIVFALYALSKVPNKPLDYKKIGASLKKNVFKLLAIFLLLYSVYLNILYANSKSDNEEYRDDYFRTLHLYDSTRLVNKKLTQKLDSVSFGREIVVVNGSE